jgi:hypothetical protein
MIMTSDGRRDAPPPPEPAKKSFDEAQRGQLMVPDSVPPTADPGGQSSQQVEIQPQSDE